MKYIITLYLILNLLSCNPETTTPQPILITDEVRIEPIKDTYQLNDTIWLISAGAPTLENIKNGNVFIKSQGSITYVMNIFQVHSIDNSKGTRSFVDIYNELDVSNSSTVREGTLMKYNIYFGCRTMSDSVFKIAIILKERGLFALNPGTSTSYSFNVQRSTLGICPVFTLSQFNYKESSNAELRLQFNHDINAKYSNEQPLDKYTQRILDNYTQEKLIYWFKVN